MSLAGAYKHLSLKNVEQAYQEAVKTLELRYFAPGDTNVWTRPTRRG